MHVKRAAPLYVAGYLPAASGIFVDERIVQAQVAGYAARALLVFAIDKLLGAHPGMTVHITSIACAESAREVRDTLLDGHEVRDVGPLAPQHAHDVVKRLRVDVHDELGVERARIVERVELPDNPLIVFSRNHVQFLDVVDEQLLPQLAGRLRKVVLVFQYPREAIRERTVEVHMAQHDGSVAPANAHSHDAASRPRGEAPFVGGTLVEHGSVIRLVHVRFEHVLGEVVVRRTDVGVAQALAHPHERAVVVARGVLVVHDEGNAELLLQIEEVLLLVPHHHDDVADARLSQLTDLPLYQHLAAHHHKPLGLLVGDGSKA